jgi:Phosphotransferase enzyme family
MKILSQSNVCEYLCSLYLFPDIALKNIEIKSGKATAKNFGLLILLSGGQRIIVKQERATFNGKYPNELGNEWQFQKLVNGSSKYDSLRSFTRAILSYDDENLIAVYSYLDDYKEFYTDILQVEVPFPHKISGWISHSLAMVHRTTFQCKDAYGRATNLGSFWNQTGSSFNLLKTRVTPELLSIAPQDYIKFISLYQRFQSLDDARMLAIKNWNPCCVVHNDLNVANILVHQKWSGIDTLEDAIAQSGVKIIDWERWSWGDPVLDLGYLIGNYLLLWLNSMVIDSSMSLEETIQSASITLKDIQPSLKNIVSQYLKTFPEIVDYLPDFFERLVRYIGLSTLIQTQAKIEHHKLLSNSDIYTLQLSKSLLCKPETSFASVFGTEAEFFMTGRSALMLT